MRKKYDISHFFDEPYLVIDFLPEQVPPESPGLFPDIEQFYLEPERYAGLREQFAHILLKLNCCSDFIVFYDSDETGIRNEDPQALFRKVISNSRNINILILPENTLISLHRDDLCMTVFSPETKLLNRIRALAGSYGLFVWKP